MAIKTRLGAAALAVLLVGGATGTALADPARATGNVNVRSGPGTQFSVVDQLRRGQRVEVLGCRFSWCFVEKPGPDGWVSGRYLEQIERRSGRPSIYFNFDFGRPPLPPGWRPGRPWVWDGPNQPPPWWSGPVRPGRPGGPGGPPPRGDGPGSGGPGSGPPGGGGPGSGPPGSGGPGSGPPGGGGPGWSGPGPGGPGSGPPGGGGPGWSGPGPGGPGSLPFCRPGAPVTPECRPMPPRRP